MPDRLATPGLPLISCQRPEHKWPAPSVHARRSAIPAGARCGISAPGSPQLRRYLKSTRSRSCSCHTPSGIRNGLLRSAGVIKAPVAGSPDQARDCDLCRIHGSPRALLNAHVIQKTSVVPMPCLSFGTEFTRCTNAAHLGAYRILRLSVVLEVLQNFTGSTLAQIRVHTFGDQFLA